MSLQHQELRGVRMWLGLQGLSAPGLLDRGCD